MAPYSEKSNLQIHLPSAAETAERNAKTPKSKVWRISYFVIFQSPGKGNHSKRHPGSKRYKEPKE